IVISGGTGFWDEPADGPWDFQGRGWGAEGVKRMAEYHRSLTTAISTDDEEIPDNRVTLADDWPADEHGAVPKVIYHPTPKSVERKTWLTHKATEILRAAGAREVHHTDIQPAFFTHIMGTMRMGADPATSVVDAGGEAHEVGRLFVGDCSILPNGLGGPNPTLTAQALAARTAEQIAARYFA
ncbi:MAG: GMC oxidoreductase, partial [Actinomycetota bacterium]